MGNFLSRLFGKPAPAPPSDPGAIDFDKDPVAVATLTDVEGSPDGRAPASGDAATAGEYERFRTDFCVRPGVTLTQAIAADPRAAELQPLLRWFHPTTHEPEPKAIIRLAVAMLDRGMQIWEQPGLTLYIHGRWSDGGGCSDASYECLEMLVYLLRKPVKILFKEQETAEEYRVTRLNPSAWRRTQPTSRESLYAALAAHTRRIHGSMGRRRSGAVTSTGYEASAVTAGRAGVSGPRRSPAAALLHRPALRMGVLIREAGIRPYAHRRGDRMPGGSGDGLAG